MHRDWGLVGPDEKFAGGGLLLSCGQEWAVRYEAVLINTGVY